MTKLILAQGQNTPIICEGDKVKIIQVKIHKSDDIVQAMVDDDSYNDVAGRSWYLDKDGYPRSSTKVNGKPINIALHRCVMGIEDSNIIVDHRDGNKLNCQRYNLRPTDQCGNSRNRICRSSSGRTGVHWDKRHNKWESAIKINGKKIHLGWFGYDDLDNAIKAREQAESEYWREIDNG